MPLTPQFPDGQFLPPFELNYAEQVIKKRIASHYPDRKLIPNRAAHITKAKPGQFKGRSECQTRDMCHTGCPFGAYFSSNSSTLPAAYNTGKLTLTSHAIVESVIYDEQKDKAIGVRVIDANTKKTTEYFARVIFLCASTLASTGILMNSKTSRFSDGLANSSGALGHYLMDHHKNIGASGILEGYEDKIYKGYRPAMVAIPRFRNVHEQEIKENEMMMRKDMKEQVGEILEVAGLKDIRVSEGSHIQGDSVHEMGTARMGRDPKTSVLNGYNQCHDVPNFFITDGSCMASSGNMSPSLTYMALTARACDYTVVYSTEPLTST